VLWALVKTMVIDIDEEDDEELESVILLISIVLMEW
jgi:hypothetical protein